MGFANMKQKVKNIMNLLRDRLILIGFGLGVAFWVIESIMHVFIFHRTGFTHAVLFPGIHETWMRLIIVGMFVSFGIYAQWLVNAKRKAREALMVVNNELTQIFETSADGMRVVDREFNMLRANDTFCELSGTRKEESIGKKCYEVFRGPLCHTVGCPLSRILSGEDRVEFDSEKIRQGGSGIPCIVTATPFRGTNGELIGIVEDFKDISERKRTEEELRQSRRRLRDLTTYLESAREKERTRIAREIHDEIGQSLTALKMELHWCIQRLPKTDKELIEKASILPKLIDANIHLVQRISSELRPGLLDDLGLSAAIEWQAGQFQERTGIECSIVFEPHDIVLDQARSTAIFRIFQETLTNIARHANATNVEILLKANPTEVELIVRDNGRGIMEKEIFNPKSFGLMGIKERVNSFGGDAEIYGTENEGTTVKVSIPNDNKEASTIVQNFGSR
jgi:PAS domain S-box-containing protein